MPQSYDVREPLLTFHDSLDAFRSGEDTPRAYLERCIATIEEREPVVKAWAALRLDGARADADASTARYAAGKPLSLIDGMPIGVKDVYSSKDLPTGLGIRGNENGGARQDSACLQAIRAAGGVFVGKTTTTELGATYPADTTNPFDEGRTPGGSSAGSAAAIGARMVPAAIGSQVGGSIIRPSSFCGNFAIKPTFGAISRGERQGLSQACLGVHAGSLTDMWRVAAEIAIRSGGDPGHPGLYGDIPGPAAVKPRRLMVMETPAWSNAEDKTITMFENVLDQLRAHGVTILRRGDDPAIEAFEASLRNMNQMISPIFAMENRSSLEILMETMPGKLSSHAKRSHEFAQTATVAGYRMGLAWRESLRLHHRALAGLADAMIAPSSLGPAPQIVDPETSLLPTGDASFNSNTSAMGGPALTLPVASIDGMPTGVQLVGQWHQDEQVTAFAQWMWDNIEPIAL